MNANNLHSLINGKWFIYEQYGQALLPSLFSIVGGKAPVTIAEADKPVDHHVTGRSLSLVSGSSYNSSESQTNYVAVISLKDPIYKYDQECGPYGTKTKMRRMASYESDPLCVGVVLDIDSGGGQVSGTPEFYDFIKNFSKPVVSYTDGMMCSAAYYIGAACQSIIANKRAEAIGSIGVMVYFINTEGMYVKKGAKVVAEYATKSTEKNKAFEELLKGNPDLYIKTELDPIAEDFIGDIKLVRPDVSEEVFKGATWNATEALDKKLIDEIGTLQTAVDKVFELADATNSNNSNNPKSKKKPMAKNTKKFSVLQGILGIEGDGIATISTMTGKSGVQLSEAQLETLENAQTNANSRVAKLEKQIAAIKNSANSAIKTAGLEKEAVDATTTSAKITLLGAKVVALGKVPGAKGTNPKSDGDSVETDENSIANASDSHNKLYNEA